MTEYLDGIEVTKTFQLLPKWTGDEIQDSYGGKPLVNFKGQPLFAELYALRMFGINGWSGVWVDSFRGIYRTELPEMLEPEILLPNFVQDKLGIINTNNGLKGTWDLLLWMNGQFKFVELKRSKKDKIRLTQINFLKSALQNKIPLQNFEIFEWEFE